MRNNLFLCACSCILAASFCQAQTTSPDGDKTTSVEGQVNHATTGEPMIHAHVIVRGAGKQYGALTTPEGKFTITGIPQGVHSVTVEKNGFVTPPGPDSRVSVQLRANEKKSGLQLKLLPSGAIAGRVLDEAGEPVEGANVSAEGVTGQTTSSDERGYFRLGGLAPGKYRVKANPGFGNGMPREIRTDGTTESHHGSTYYPGVASAKEATWVEVRPAGESGGTDIHLRLVPWVRVSGKVTGLPEGNHASLMARPAGSFNVSGFSMIRPNGTFEIWSLEPGKFILSAMGNTPGTQPVKTVDQEIEIGSGNLDGIELRVVPPSDLTGRIEFEDEATRLLIFPPQKPDPQKTDATATKNPRPPAPRPSLMFRDAATGGMSQTSVRIDETGIFVANTVQAARYSIRLMPGSVYIKSMRMGSQNMEGDIVDLRNGAAGGELSILVSSKVASVSGIVTDERGNLPGARVVLTPAGPEDSMVHRYYGMSDESGKYQINDVPPGSYHLVAVAEGDANAVMQRSGALDDYEALMETVEIHPEDKIVKDLKRRVPGEQ
jgi:protocatechuate 3,4-dioxygenase beta subunit